MAQTFLEQILNLRLYQIFSKIDVEAYLSPAVTTSMCTIDSVAQQWFGMSPQAQCVVLNQTSNGGYDVFSAPSATAPNANQTKLGTLQPLQANLFDVRSRPAIILNLTSDQKLFTTAQTASREFMNGPSVIDQGGNTTFVPVNGSAAPKSAYFRISPTSIALFGSSGPQVKPVFLYNSPLAAALMISTSGPSPVSTSASATRNPISTPQSIHGVITK